jgi:aminoglycoside phosphotransferase (APT) family kinase protein
MTPTRRARAPERVAILAGEVALVSGNGAKCVVESRIEQDRLLEALRRRSGVPGLRFATAPVPVSGGFWAEILVIRLVGAPPELDRELIVRIMPDPAIAQREAIVQSEVVSQGFPAPAVRLIGKAEDGLDRPFMVMDRAPGRPPMGDLNSPPSPLGLARAALRLPRLLANVAARLHRLDPAPVRDALRAVAGVVVDVEGLVDLLEERAAAARRSDLAHAAAWLRRHRPTPGREAICHGDLHPFNLLVEDGRVSVIDWSVALVADPAFDLAFTATMMAMPPLDLLRPVRFAVRAGARATSRRFLRRYRRVAGPDAEASLATGVFDWHGAIHCLRALVEAAEWTASGTAEQRAGHPWLSMAPDLATRLSEVIGQTIQPL